METKKIRYRRGVGACIFNSKNQILVAERLDIPGAWQLIQGGVDGKEPPQHALFREILEEAGIERQYLTIIQKANRWLYYDFPHPSRFFKGRYKGQTQLWYALRFTGLESHINLNYSTHPEFSHYQWISLNELPDIAVSFKQDVYRSVVNEFKNLVDK